MNSRLMNEGEDITFIKDAMLKMMSNIKAWTNFNYPDRDRINRERMQEEQERAEEGMAAQPGEKQLEK
eukprot:8762600-Heterocapsa_arctica.AAC.1